MAKVRGAALSLAICLSPAASGAVPVAQVGSFTFTVSGSGSPAQIPYDANLSLGGSHPQVLRAVVLVHGTSRSARNAYETLIEAADLAGVDDGTSLLLAPQFLIEEDVEAHQLPAEYVFWSDSGWKEGNLSLSTLANPRPTRISSFAIIDSILARIAAANPNLQSLVLAGHSAGGQFVNRFAAGSTVADAVWDALGVRIAYVVANPSSYLYLDGWRVIPPSANQFAIPPAGTLQSCPDYDHYKYGLLERNSYMSRLSSAQIVSRYRDAPVAVLLGEMDDDPAAADLDTTCAAMLQGSSRLERGRIFGYYLRHLFGPSIAQEHRTLIVPGVGHSAEDMFTSPCGVAELFGGGGCGPVDAEPGAMDAGTTALRPRLDSHPNPFETKTAIVYRMTARRSTVRIYDIRGRLVRTLHAEADAQGRGTLVWDARSNTGERLPAGVYLFRLQDGGTVAIERSTLLR
jgi:hypothetical protein